MSSLPHKPFHALPPALNPVTLPPHYHYIYSLRPGSNSCHTSRLASITSPPLSKNYKVQTSKSQYLTTLKLSIKSGRAESIYIYDRLYPTKPFWTWLRAESSAEVDGQWFFLFLKSAASSNNRIITCSSKTETMNNHLRPQHYVVQRSAATSPLIKLQRHHMSIFLSLWLKNTQYPQ